MRFISTVDPAPYHDILNLWNPPVPIVGAAQSCGPQQGALGCMSYSRDFPRKEDVLLSNTQRLLVLIKCGKWAAGLCPCVSLWMCLFQSCRVELFCSLHILTSGLWRGERFSVCCALLLLMFLKEVCFCTVSTVTGFFPEGLVKASSVIPVILLSIYI